MNQKLILFAFWCVFVAYFINCLIAKKIKRIEIRPMLMYVSAVATIGVYGEVFVGSLYTHLFHKDLWHYTIFPVHHAYTSKYAVVLWGIYGFYLYLMHGLLKANNIHRIRTLSLMFAVEAVVVEALVNLTFLIVFGHFLFYYFPTDLWHITSLQTLPFYLAGGYVITRAILRFEVDPTYFTRMCAAFIIVLIFLT